jgi:hypothetical protein
MRVFVLRRPKLRDHLVDPGLTFNGVAAFKRHTNTVLQTSGQDCAGRHSAKSRRSLGESAAAEPRALLVPIAFLARLVGRDVAPFGSAAVFRLSAIRFAPARDVALAFRPIAPAAVLTRIPLSLSHDPSSGSHAHQSSGLQARCLDVRLSRRMNLYEARLRSVAKPGGRARSRSPDRARRLA